MKKRPHFLISIIVLCLVSPRVLAVPHSPIRYVALGDSYTIGTGTHPNKSWPALITQRLKKKDISVELVANLGRNGWTTQNLIDYELPVLKKLQPDFVTVLIGVNDWVQGVGVETFQGHISYIFDQLLRILPSAKNILVITIPDFSVMPAGRQYSRGRDIAKGIAEFNQIMIKETKRHGLNVVDLYPLSQTMGEDLSLAAADGLHPSAKGYARWADLIEPEFRRCLP